MVQDPVCGMRVEEQQARDKSQVGERTLYFCSGQCKKEFDREPQRYLTQGGRPAVEEQSQPRI
ncbi:MAG: YHS domain-containing protein [Polyangia bacterium]